MTALFHVVAINERTGDRTRMTAYPEPHEVACRIKGKISSYPSRRLAVEPDSPCPHPPKRLFSWWANGPDLQPMLCVGCCACGAILKGGAS